MKLRFRILQVSANGGSGLVNGQTPITASYGSLNVVVALDGTIIYDNSPSVLTTATIAVGGQNVTITFGNNSKVLVQIPNAKYTDERNLYIKVTHSGGFNVYENTWTIYGYDLGIDAAATNNLGYAVTNHEEIDILLVDSTATDTIARFVAYKIPLTNNVQLIDLSSGNGLTTFHTAGGGLLGAGISVIGTLSSGDVYCKKMIVETNFFSISKTISIPVWKYCPEMAISIIEPGNENPCFYFTGKKARTSLNFNGVTQVWVNDVALTPFISPTLVYTLRNRLDEIVAATTINLTFTNVFTAGFNPVTTNWNLPTFDIAQSYRLEAIISSDCQYNCVETLEIPFCFEDDITHVDCNNYVITNIHGIPLTATIYKWVAAVWIEQSANILVQNASQSVTLTDGIYKIKFRRGDIFYEKLVLADCNVQQCLVQLIKTVLCNATAIVEDDCSCNSSCNCTTKITISDNDILDINILTIEYMQYLNLINEVFVVNPIFTVLPSSLEASLIRVDGLLNHFSTVCQNCS